MIGYPVICTWAVIKYRKRLEEKSIKDRIFQMYNGIHTSKYHKYSVLFYPIMIFRRLIFVLVPMLVTHPAQQVQLLSFFSSMYIIAYGQIMPHHDKLVSFFELFNEAMFMVMNYHLYMFSNGYIKDDSKMTQYTMGYSYLGCIAILILGNMVLILTKAVRKAKRAKELKALRKAHLARIAHD
jgi:hypothetical protein